MLQIKLVLYFCFQPTINPDELAMKDWVLLDKRASKDLSLIARGDIVTYRYASNLHNSEVWLWTAGKKKSISHRELTKSLFYEIFCVVRKHEFKCKIVMLCFIIDLPTQFNSS